MTTVLETSSFVTALRAQSQRYHHRHPFHRRMNEGGLDPHQLQGWVANRFYYQVNLPRKDAAILSNCPDREVRRRWITRIADHDGTAGEQGGIEAWLRLAEATGLTRTEVMDMSSPGCGLPSTPISPSPGPGRGSRRWPRR
jgi:pyrroloquinoline-quinone synthase